jgi:predicted permease
MWLFLRRLRARLTHRHFDSDLQDELATHREMTERELIQGGANAEEARAGAARALGNLALAREDARRVWIAGWVETVWQDAHYALRMLRRSPLFACTAIGALVLGVSLNISLFTVFNAFVLRAWPVGHADRVVVIQQRNAFQTTYGMPPAETRFLNAHARSIEVVAYDEGPRVQIGGDATGQEAPVRIVSANFFSALEIPLQLGGGFVPSDDDPLNARPVVVLSGPAWRNRFGGDAAIIGRSVNLNNVPFTVIGVAVDGAGDSPATVPPDGWLPIVAVPLLEPSDPFARGFPVDPHKCCVKVAGRLRDQATPEAAAAELRALDQQFSVTFGVKPAVDVRVTSTRLIDQPGARLVPLFALTFIGTLLLLLLACANVGNLLLARALARQREIAIRLALGAGRARVVRQLLTEGLVLAGVAMAVALPIAKLLPSLIFHFIDSGSATNPHPLDFGLDPAVLLFASVVAIMSSLLFSLAPALRGTRVVAASVRATRAGAIPNRLPLRTALLAVQVAISAVLLVAAGLLSRGIMHAAGSDLGFKTEGLMAAAIDLPKNAYSDSAQNALGDQLASQLSAAGIGTMGFSSLPPMGSMGMPGTTLPTGVGKQADTVGVFRLDVSPGYFDVLRIQTVEGRIFSEHEPHAVVINRALERVLFRGESAIGKPLQRSAAPDIVVGVVNDAQISGFGLVPPTFFRPAHGFSQVVIAANTPEVTARIRSVVKALEPRAVVMTTRMSDSVKTQLQASMFGAAIAVGIGLSALLLAGIGVFGVFSYMVAERAHEIGVRLALGARGSDIVRTVLGGVGVAIGSGLGIGLLLAAGAGSLLSRSLYDLSPRDPVAFAWAVGVLATAALASTALPVWRALRVDPASTLRQD